MLYEKLNEYAASGVYPMHMPGHKRNTAFLSPGMPYEIDVSEIHGFDNLHDPQGILRETAQIAAEIYGSGKSFPLINGSTAGILAAIGAHAGYGEKILMARNCHISVYNAVALFGIEPVYIMPETDESTCIACSIEPMSVERALAENEDVKLIVVTSPTYEGVISDIRSIAAIAHKRDIPLLVDCAHGAHLGFSLGFPESAVQAGADVVVMSLHKTLPALTQCALLHICGDRAGMDEISRLLTVFQTSSPSYVLMASIDKCLRLLLSDGDRLFCEYERNLDKFNRDVEALHNLEVLYKGKDMQYPGFFALDSGKVVIITKKTALGGLMLADILRKEHKIEIEMACGGYAVAMTSICDTTDGLKSLSNALTEVDRSLPKSREEVIFETQKLPVPKQAETPGNALKRRGFYTKLEESIGLMSLEFIWAYPPGIPIIAPGEIISAQIVSYIKHMASTGIKPKSTRGRLPEFVQVTSDSE